MKRWGLLALVVVVAGAAGAWWVHRRLVTPYRGFAGDTVFVEVPAGTGLNGIADRLAGAGVVPDPLTFRVAARVAGVERHLEAGEYRFAGASTPLDVAVRLGRGDVFTRSVTFPEGLTIAEMAQTFAHSGLGTASEFEEAASNGSLVAAMDPDASTLEGYLFPDTYALARHAGADAAVRVMVERFDRAFDPSLRAAAAAEHMNVREVVTLASLIEKETARPEERPIVSAVYRNRLQLRMPLQCDPTVIYALMQAGEWTGNLRKQDLAIDSPYNTYRYQGLPPGPIASPSRPSLEAALHPADVKYLYFVSRNDGTHAFATTLAEHNRNVAKYQLHRIKKN
jgi:peptidoglycan lytic transglycosylase G